MYIENTLMVFVNMPQIYYIITNSSEVLGSNLKLEDETNQNLLIKPICELTSKFD